MTADAATDWREPLLLRLTGGPQAGILLAHDGEDDMAWPLPATFQASDDGQYCKVSESALPPQPEGSHAVRGAEYEWEPA